MKEYVSARDFSTLLQYDQLKIQQAQGNTFVNYVEGEISFPPTYKYDLFSDDYDTSEKCRAPAWTDRVLFRKRRDHGQKPGRIAYYGRAELKQSDHRPVMAFIDIDILETRMDKTRAVLEDVVGRLGPPDATVVVQLVGKSEQDEDQTSWADDESLLTGMLARVNQTAGDVLLIRFAHEGLLLTLRDGAAALAAVSLSPMQVCDFFGYLQIVFFSILVFKTGEPHKTGLEIKNYRLASCCGQRLSLGCCQYSTLVHTRRVDRTFRKPHGR